MHIRPATEADCVAMSRVRSAAITQLCSADHGDDPDTVTAWVDRQSPETFRLLLWRPEVTLLVADLDGAVVGVAGFSGDKVTLNYVDPDHRFAGISKALMAALEAQMLVDGVSRGRLDSTATARDFYRAIGWIEQEGGTPEQGYPMSKLL
jgi:GNAT superfamily N-acetyltransferase